MIHDHLRAHDRYKRQVREILISATADALDEILLDDHGLRARRKIAAHVVDAQLPVYLEFADLFGTDGQRVAKLFWAIEQLRWELERAHRPVASSAVD